LRRVRWNEFTGRTSCRGRHSLERTIPARLAAGKKDQSGFENLTGLSSHF
jgi:hypothetical protein